MHFMHQTKTKNSIRCTDFLPCLHNARQYFCVYSHKYYSDTGNTLIYMCIYHTRSDPHLHDSLKHFLWVGVKQSVNIMATSGGDFLH